jgi:hypothetical protein
MKRNLQTPISTLTMAAVALAAGFASTTAHAGRDVKNTTRTSVNKNVNANANVNKNVNVNSNVNKNVNVNSNRHVDVDVDVDRDYHPVGTALAVGATVAVTSAIIGSTVNALPPACVPVQVGNILYQQCGTTWYQPQYVGTTVQYVVVTPVR